MPIILTSPPPSPPALDDILHWFDFTDISTLFQDTGGLTPVTSNGQVIARINNKGSDATNLIQATAAQQPTYDTAKFSFPAGSFDGTDALTGTTGISRTIPFSIGIVFAISATGAAGFAQALGTSTNILTFKSSGDLLNLNNSNHAVESTNPLVIDTVSSGYSVARAIVTEQETWINLDAGSDLRTGTASLSFSAGLDHFVGAVSDVGGLGWPGWIMEYIVWNAEDTGAGPTQAAWQAYTITKYGVAWA